MSKIIAVCLLIGGILGGCSTVNRQQLSPKKLFVVHIGEQFNNRTTGRAIKIWAIVKTGGKGGFFAGPNCTGRP